jgi:predicted O-methyltransferase YrrM
MTNQLIEETIAVSIPFNFPNMMHGFVFPQDVEGYLEPVEGAYLNLLARLSPPGVIVELGTYKGRSAICLAQAGPVYSVDHFQGERFENVTPEAVEAGSEDALGVHRDHYFGTYRPDTEANLARYGVAERVHLLDMDSADAAEMFRLAGDRVALLFVDAAHHYNAVKRDYLAWKDLIAPGGAIAFHDRNFSGVARFLAELENEEGWHREDGPEAIAVMYPPQEG